jgi:hypothetical protein
MILFSNGTEFMVWQTRNCERCVKAVWYNEKKGMQPKYRCKIQNEIELAAVTDGTGSKRAANATHKAVCPYLKTQRTPKRKKDVEPKLFEL